jgi:two-component system sensor histidine kinase DesK
MTMMVVPREIDYPFMTSAGRRPRWWRFAISLIWMAFPLGALFSDGVSAVHIALVLIGFAGFVLCYGNALVGPWDRIAWQRRVPWLVGGAVIASVLVIADRPDWGILFIFLAVVSGVRLPEPQSVVAIGLAVVLGTGTMLIGGSETWSAVSVGLSAGGIGFLFLLINRLSRAYEELRSAQDELARAAVNEERVRFARDLHDLLGHSLSLVALKAQLAGRLIDSDPAGAHTQVQEIESVTREALSEVRAAVSGYARPTLAGELAGARRALEAAGIEPQLDATVELPEDVDELLAWTIREGTTNVLRHSDARTARIVVANGRDSAAVEVVDDGGASAGSDDVGHGLAGLRERAARIGGSVEAGPAPGGGFRLRVEVPLA